MRRVLVLFLVVAAAPACSSPPAEAHAGVGWSLTLEPVASGTTVLLQAVSPVDEEVVWVSGHGASYARSLDGGERWEVGVVPNADGLQFRDVAAFDASTAYLMSAGSGELSRLYRTDDGGGSWTLQHTARDPGAFFDCMDFWDVDRGLVYGDAVDDRPFILETEDGGAIWSRVPSEGLPPALEGEGGFAASGSCLTTGPGGRAWIATGAGPRARVLLTENYGRSWRAVEPPVVGGAAAGLTTVGVAPSGAGIALGGIIGRDSVRSQNVTVTKDGGDHWLPGGALSMDGPVYGASLVPGTEGLVVAVGPRGLDWSPDGGVNWHSADTLSYWAVAFASPARGWAVGPGGRVTRLAFTRR
jgi:photosystem II stability/assembly factor-like uncharacterized protein